MTCLSSQSISFYRILLCAPHFGVRDLGRLAITSAVFGRRGDSGFGQRTGLNLIEQAIRCRCCSILKQKLETEHQATEVERLDVCQTAWRRLFCLTEPTCKKCKGSGTIFLPKKLRKLAKTEAEKVFFGISARCVYCTTIQSHPPPAPVLRMRQLLPLLGCNNIDRRSHSLLCAHLQASRANMHRVIFNAY